MGLGRARLQRSWEVKQGIEWAMSRSPLPYEVFEAVTSSPQEAQALMDKTNAQRQEAGFLERHGLQDEG